MLAEDELVKLLDDVLLVLRVLLVQSLNEFCFHKALLVETLFVFQDLERNELFLLVVEAPQNNPKGAFS